MKSSRKSRRKFFARLFSERQCKIGAEVGILRGNFSVQLLTYIPTLEVLYSIDNWCGLNGIFREDIYKDAENRLRIFGQRSKLIVGTSPYAADLFPDSYFDFVYIDADHSYEAVRLDLETWFKKLKAGGIFCGDDYWKNGVAYEKHFAPKRKRGKCGVIQALTEFREKYDDYVGELGFVTGDSLNWWFEKSQ